MDRRHLTRAQYEQILELTALYLDSPGSGPGLKPVLDGMRAIFNAEGCMLTEGIPRVRQHVLARSGPRVPVERMTREFSPHPLMTHYARTGDPRVHSVDDVAGSSWCRSPTYQALRDLLGISRRQRMRELAVPLQAPAGTTRAFAMYRTGTEFSNQERVIGQHLQPLLQRIDAHLQILDRCRPPHPNAATAGGSPRTDPGVTPRELAVLVLLSDGATAAAISRRLGVAVSTVNSHLEHLYRKLDTNNRLTTVLRARRLGLITTPDADSTTAGSISRSMH